VIFLQYLNSMSQTNKLLLTVNNLLENVCPQQSFMNQILTCAFECDYQFKILLMTGDIICDIFIISQ
jgi:hypothetical protein